VNDEPLNEKSSDYRAFWIVVSIATLIGALFVCFLAYFFYSFEFENSEGGKGFEGALLVLALVGLIPVLGMLKQSIDGHSPGRWFLAVLCVYAPFVTLYLIGLAL
jgi:hypothetical protein